MYPTSGNFLPIMLIYLFIVHFVSVCEVRPQDAVQSVRVYSVFDSMDAFVQQEMSQQQIPGFSLAITNKDSLLYLKHYGYADLKLKSPLTDTTLFQIGSISKSFTAIALLKLADQGKLDLTKPVSHYLPWFTINTSYAPITIHHLLTHSAGLPANRDDIATSTYMGYAVRYQHTGWPPGTRFYYANTGYQILHLLVEKLSHNEYQTVIEKDIFKILGMKHSRAVISMASRAEQAVGYMDYYDDRPSHPTRSPVEAPYFEYTIGDGSIQSTAIDMAAYLRMLLNGGKVRNLALLSGSAFRELTSRQIVLSSDSAAGYYGYGLFLTPLNGRELLSHRGGMIGFTALISADTSSGMGAVFLTNGNAELNSLRNYCFTSLYAARQNERIPAYPRPKDLTYLENAEVFSGDYANSLGKKLQFRARKKHLYLLTGSGENILLSSYGKDRFYTPSRDYDLYIFQFVRDSSKHVSEVYYGPEYYSKNLPADSYEGQVPPAWHAYTGKYRSYSPWFPYFEIFIRKNKLIALAGQGGEAGGEEYPLIETAPGIFQIGEDYPQERIGFYDILDNRALRAVWSGHPFYRIH